MKPRRNENVELTETDEGLVVYQIDRERVHALNMSAAVIFELCDGILTVEEIAVKVAAIFELSDPPLPLTIDCVDHFVMEGLVEFDLHSS